QACSSLARCSTWMARSAATISRPRSALVGWRERGSRSCPRGLLRLPVHCAGHNDCGRATPSPECTPRGDPAGREPHAQHTSCLLRFGPRACRPCSSRHLGWPAGPNSGATRTSEGIVHRDLKPSNVLIALYDGKPVPKVIDFGVAKAAEQSL